MDLSRILPPSDLLDKVRGIEAGLRQRKRLGAGGAAASILSAAAYLALANASSLKELLTAARDNWLLALIAFVTIALFLLSTWATFWLRESRQPFRYTCSIGQFEVIGEAPQEEQNKLIASYMQCMPHDLTRLLNDRVRRFFFAGAQAGHADDATGAHGDPAHEPYIHIRGYCVIRKGQDAIEIMPRVRLGAATSPEVMASPAVFEISRLKGDTALEQVYHSIVTEIYRQLKEDVKRKIALLPTRRLRAAALLHEADDYARSNSLHAYDEARDLYKQAAALLDPEWRDVVHTRTRRFLRMIARVVYKTGRAVRRVKAFFRPAAQTVDVLAASAVTGYARMMLFAQPLAAQGGRTNRNTWETAPVAARAVAALERLGRDAPGRTDALFHAYVTQALACDQLGDRHAAWLALEKARAVRLRDAEEDAVYLYASSRLAAERNARLALLRRSVELAPRFEVAQFDLAGETEALWRSRDRFERATRDQVLDEYRAVLKINPGNLGGWSNIGYVHWLLGDLEEAMKAFQEGARFKAIAKDIFTSELDYGLTRIYAELGQFDEAYKHYVAATSSVSLRLQGANDFKWYYFDQLTEAGEMRFRQYRRNVVARFREARKTAGASDDAARVRKSVLAFVIHDAAESYSYRYSVVKTDAQRKRTEHRVRRLLRLATRINERFAAPYYTLASFFRFVDPEQALDDLRRSMAFLPQSPDARLLMAQLYAAAARRRVESNQPAEGEWQRVMQVARSFLPHPWLWSGERFRWEMLGDRRAAQEMRWSREFGVYQVQALWLLAQRPIAENAANAPAIVRHIHSCYWPLDAEICGAMRTVVLPTLKENEQKELRRKLIRLAPDSVTDLEGLPSSLEETRRFRDELLQYTAAPAALRKLFASHCLYSGAGERDRKEQAAWYALAAETAPEDADVLREAARGLADVYCADASAVSPARAESVANLAVERARSDADLLAQAENVRQRITHLRTMESRFGDAPRPRFPPPEPLIVELSPALAAMNIDWPALTKRARLVQGVPFPIAVPQTVTDETPRFVLRIYGRVAAQAEVPDPRALEAQIESALHANALEFLRLQNLADALPQNWREHMLKRLLMPELTMIVRLLYLDGWNLGKLQRIAGAVDESCQRDLALLELAELVRAHRNMRSRNPAFANHDAAAVRRADAAIETLLAGVPLPALSTKIDRVFANAPKDAPRVLVVSDSAVVRARMTLAGTPNLHIVGASSVPAAWAVKES